MSKEEWTRYWRIFYTCSVMGDARAGEHLLSTFHTRISLAHDLASVTSMAVKFESRVKKNLQEVYTSLPCNSVGIHFLSVWKHPNSVLLAPNTAESQDSCFVTIPCFGMGFKASRDLDLKLFTTLTQRACRCHVTLSRWGSGGCVVTSLYWAFYLCFRVQYCGFLRNYLELSKKIKKVCCHSVALEVDLLMASIPLVS